MSKDVYKSVLKSPKSQEVSARINMQRPTRPSLGPVNPGRVPPGLKIQNSVPYSHPPLPEEPSGLYDLLITDSDMALSKKKFLKVSSIGEVEVEPDRVEFCIQIQTSRTECTLAKESIKKREDYIIGTLKKYRVPDVDIKSTEFVTRTDPEDENTSKPHKARNKNADEVNTNKHTADKDNNNSSGLNWRKEICVTCKSLLTYMQIYSICMEKLDRHVVVSQPVVRFSPEHMQNFTHKAVKLAMDNGISKAKELLNSMKRRVVLGRLYYSVEDSMSVQRIEEYENTKVMSSQFESFNWRKRNKVILCNLTSVFELDYPKNSKPRSAI